ncbi:hypothetical protein [Arthrobacter bambusae]|uniref:hypothetical protein n=1 Tax=Arthrobacter bambusae TaxID=1338426 RepID=UPI002782E676|nr:hypothetical protein [Arthrobacter bambusae]MDQ0242001.1 poly(3-hydroxyalkanoate) synthetase [Arthrobacter bambusae]
MTTLTPPAGTTQVPLPVSAPERAIDPRFLTRALVEWLRARNQKKGKWWMEPEPDPFR